MGAPQTACSTSSPSAPKGDFSLKLSPENVSATKGGTSQVNIAISRTGGLDESIALSLENAPSGVTGTFAPENTIGDSSTLTLNISVNTQPGEYPLNIKGKSSSLSKTAVLNLKITSLPPSEIEVNEELVPIIPLMPSFDDDEPRPVVKLQEANGSKPAEFVENEIVVMTDDKEELAAFLNRWQGKVLQEVDVAKFGSNGLKPIYLIRVNATSVDASTLADNLLEISPDRRSDLQVSSQKGLNLLALLAQEAASGLTIGINWLTQSDSFLDDVSNESPNGPTNQGYSSNAFDWSIFRLDTSPRVC